VMKAVLASLIDLSMAIDERPDDVKTALKRLYPDLDAKTIDLLFQSETSAWKKEVMTPADISHDISIMKAAGVPLPQIDKVDPASIIYP
jgi:hypothetical protein